MMKPGTERRFYFEEKSRPGLEVTAPTQARDRTPAGEE
jgi:hypothetical protein